MKKQELAGRTSEPRLFLLAEQEPPWKSWGKEAACSLQGLGAAVVVSGEHGPHCEEGGRTGIDGSGSGWEASALSRDCCFSMK